MTLFLDMVNLRGSKASGNVRRERIQPTIVDGSLELGKDTWVKSKLLIKESLLHLDNAMKKLY